jgi:glycosyltransferase involved in cell wall biosynthesis
MRILHVVTLISPDGAYGARFGGAVKLPGVLLAAAHDVTVVAACRGFDDVPTQLDGVPVRLFPAATLVPGIGFAGLRAKGMRRWLRAELPQCDVVHVHLARDLVTLPAARIALQAGRTLVAQPHGMIDPSGRAAARPLDRYWTVPVLRAAAAVFHLTAQEATDLTAVAGEGLPLRELPNGVPTPEVDRTAATAEPDVLFLARLHPRKRPEMFIRMAEKLLADGIRARFSLVGANEGAVVGASGDPRIQLEGPVAPSAVAARLARAAIYVLPAVDEPFPMSVIEAMSVGLPVVVTHSCGLAPLIAETDSGRVVGHDLASLTNAVGELLADPATATAMGARGRVAVRSRLSMSTVVDRLEDGYRAALAARGVRC